MRLTSLRTMSQRWLCLVSVLVAACSLSHVAIAEAAGPKVAPDQAIERLHDGNARFVSGKATHPNTGPERMAETFENGQHPFATVITCSDSRVPVELLFDQGIGDIFVIRVAGNVCDVDEVGSIEYGVDHLATPVLVVLGHTNCGAVTAVVTEAELHGSIPPLVDNIKPAAKRVQQAHPKLHGKALIPKTIEANVWQSIDDLFKASAATRQRVQAGTLKVVGAIYDIRTGEVGWLGAHPEQTRLLTSADSPHGHACDKAKGESPTCSIEAYRSGAAAAKKNPDRAIAFLKEGNARFVGGRSIQPNIDAARLRQAGRENQGDHAFATVITCSDSRVPVEHIFDVGVMDTFIIRVAGNVCDTDEIGSIEYGLAHVNTPVLVVLGHTQCGAVTAVTHAVHGKGHALERNIPPLVDNIQPAVERAMKRHADVHGDAIIPHAIEENVWQSIEDLYLNSPSTRELVRSGKAKVVGAIYDVGTGKIMWLPEEKSMELLAKAERNPDRAINAMADHPSEGAGHGAGHSERPTGQSGHDHAASTAIPTQTHKTGVSNAPAVEATPSVLSEPAKLERPDKAHRRAAQAETLSLSMPEAGAEAQKDELPLQGELIERLTHCELLIMRIVDNEIEFMLDAKGDRVKEMERSFGALRTELERINDLICNRIMDEEA